MNSATNSDFPGFETITVLEDARDAIIRARNTRTGEEVVIKLLDRAKEPVLPKRFDRGRRTLLNLTKRGIGLVPLLGNGVASDGRDYIISPYYPLGSLQDQILAGPTPWRLAAEIVGEIAGTVGLVHGEHLALGDLRPSNIFLESVGKPAVAAFGVATRRFDDGRPEFVAPESSGHQQTVTPTSDVYSLALVFGALIAGRARARNESDDEFLSEVEGLAPRRIMDVLEHGLAPSPTNRYRDAATMQRAIRLAVEADPDTLAAEHGTDADLPSDGLDVEDMLAPLAATPPPPMSATDTGPIAPESLPPGLEDITFASGNGVTTDDPSPEDSDSWDEDLDLTAFERDVDPDTEDFFSEADNRRPNGDGSGQNGDGTNGAGGGVNGRGRRAAMAAATTLDGIRPADEDGSRAGGRPERDLVTASVASVEDQTSVLRLDELTEADAPDTIDTTDQTNVLQLDELAVGDAPDTIDTSDQTNVLQLDELTETEDQTSVLQLDELTGANGVDQTSVLRLDELTETDAPDTIDTSDQTNVLQLDELAVGDAPDTIDTSDQTNVLQLDELTESTDHGAAVERNGHDLGVSDEAFADDETNVFGDHVEQSPPPPTPETAIGGLTTPPFGPGDMPYDPALPSDEIPFQSVERNHKQRAAATWKDRLRVAIEVAWFRSRRAIGSAAAVAGLLAIAAVIIYFLAREVQSGIRVETEGVFESTTTLAPSTPSTFVATNVPPVTVDGGTRRTTTTVAPPRPPTTALAPSEETEDPTEDDGDQDGTNGLDQQIPPEDEVLPPGQDDPQDPPPSDDGQGGQGDEPGSEDEPSPPATEPPPDPEPPTEEPPAPDPPDDSDPPEPDPPEVEEPVAAPPPSLALSVTRVREQSAVVAINSDQCVAMQFTLTGGGETQAGSSGASDPGAKCSPRWRLSFSGSSGLQSDTNYTLSVSVKAEDTNLVSNSSVSFTTDD